MSEEELNKNYIRGIIKASNNNEELLVNEIRKLCSKQYIEGLEQGKFDMKMEWFNLQKRIDKVIELLDNYQNNLYSKTAREILDDDIETAIKLLKGEKC